MDNWLLMLGALLLVLLNGFFVAAEFAIVKLRLTQAEELAEDGGIFARVLRSVRSDHRWRRYFRVAIWCRPNFASARRWRDDQRLCSQGESISFPATDTAS